MHTIVAFLSLWDTTGKPYINKGHKKGLLPTTVHSRDLACNEGHIFGYYSQEAIKKKKNATLRARQAFFFWYLQESTV
jgi:hypothetical protein